jgi:LacI family transcriptional regulator
VATITDVAQRAGVSPTTAKRAIRRPDLLAPATLERVQRAIRDLAYEPDKLASALRSGENKTVGLVIGSIVEPFFAELTRAVGRNLRALGYTLIVAENEYDSALEEVILREFYGNRVGGLILRPGYGGYPRDYLLQMQARGAAIVEIDYRYPESPFSHVLLDNAGAAMTAVAHLHALGHRRLAYVGMVSRPGQPEERHEGFLEAVRHFGLALPDAYHAANAGFFTMPSEEGAYQITRQLFAQPEPPTAIFAFNGDCTSGAFRALRDLGLIIPAQVSLVGFDNYVWTRLVDPPLDVLEQPTERMAAAAVDILLAAVTGDRQAVVSRRFPARFIRRGSSAPPVPG